MTTLICIRHGQSEINLARRLTGQLDPPLTPLGVEQARRTAEFLRSQPITRIYSSDLVRCMDTAAPTAAMHGLPVIPEPAFREIFAGKWEGMTFDAITAAYPESHHVWMTDMGRAHPDGGESVAQLYDRVTAAMERVVPGKRGRLRGHLHPFYPHPHHGLPLAGAAGGADPPGALGFQRLGLHCGLG